MYCAWLCPVLIVLLLFTVLFAVFVVEMCLLYVSLKRGRLLNSLQQHQKYWQFELTYHSFCSLCVVYVAQACRCVVSFSKGAYQLWRSYMCVGSICIPKPVLVLIWAPDYCFKARLEKLLTNALSSLYLAVPDPGCWDANLLPLQSVVPHLRELCS